VTCEGKKLVVKLTNHAAEAIDSGLICVGGVCLKFAGVEPGKTVTVEGEGKPWTRDCGDWRRPKDADAKYLMYGEGGNLNSWLVMEAQGVGPRTKGIERRLENGDAVIYAVIRDRESCPLSIRDKRVKTTHTRYMRLIVPHVQRGS